MVASDKPRLLVIVNVFNPDRGGGGAIFSDLCYGLAERGFDVTVRCAYPYYPEWRDKWGKNGLRIQRYVEKGVRIERYGIYIPTKPRSLVQRLLYEASFFLSLMRSLPNGRRFDFVMTYCPLVGAVAFAAIHKCVFRRPLWLNVQDLSADAAAASGIAKGRTVKRLLSGVQSFLFNRADVWSSISPVMVSRLEQIRNRNQNVLYLPNWLNASMAEEIRKLPSKCGREEKMPVRLLYAGNIGGKQDLLRFCRILASSDAEFRFVVHGNGAEAESVRAWIHATNDERFAFGDFLDEADFARVLHDTDFFVVTEKSGSGSSFIPCKIIAGIASHTPILAVCDSDSPLAKEMAENCLGPLFSWSNIESVPRFLKERGSRQGEFLRWQENALKRSRFYDRDEVVDRFASAIMDVFVRTQE